MESVLKYNSTVSEPDLKDTVTIRNVAEQLDIAVQANFGIGKILIEIFEKTVESKLEEPTFITAYHGFH